MKYNDFEEFRDKKLGANETKIYELLNMKPDPENQGRILCPRTYVRATDVIIINNEVKEIAAIERESPSGEITLDTGISFSIETNGRLILKGNRPLDQKRYPYLEFSNYNLSNPNRDKTITAIYKEVDTKADQAKSAAQIVAEGKALSSLAELSFNDLKLVSEELKVNGGTKDELIIAINASIKKDAKKVLDVINGLSKKPDVVKEESQKKSPSIKKTRNKVQKLVVDLMTKGELVIGEGDKSVSIGDDEIFTFTKDEFEVAELVTYLISNDVPAFDELYK